MRVWYRAPIMDEIGTPRLRLIACTPVLREAEQAGPDALSRALEGIEVPEEWPAKREAGSGGNYVVLRATEAGGRPLLIGFLHGQCTLLDDFQGCGFADEAAGALREVEAGS